MWFVTKIVFFISLFLNMYGEKLMNMETGSIVVEFLDGTAQFSDCFLAIEMKQNGIYIPPFKNPDFDGKEVVYMDDWMFEKAFLEVYYPLCIANPLYQWQD
jgi:hypothetical protein